MNGWQHTPVPVFQGAYDTRAGTGRPYPVRPLGEVLTAPPARADKMDGPAFLPSLYAAPDARCHAVQKSRGRFVALVADIDGGNHSLARLEALVGRLAPGAPTLAYSSPHARPGDMRWRLVLPLAEPLPFPLWHETQHALFACLADGGVRCDGAMSRAAQPVYLPNVPTVHGKTGEALRDPPGRPLYFERRGWNGRAPGLSLASGPLFDQLQARAARRKADTIKRPLEAERARKSRLRCGSGGSPIEAFNAAHAVPDLLRRYGYRPDPQRPEHWRSPHQTAGTFATRVMENGRWVSLSASDVGTGLGTARDGVAFGDAFDLFCHFEHGGNRTAALRALSAERRSHSAWRGR